MQVRDLKPPVQPTIPTETDVRENGRDRTKADQGAVSQRANLQPEVKFATSKLSKVFSKGQNWLPPTNRSNPSGAFQAQQFANAQKQYFPSQRPNLASITRDDHFIRYILPELELTEFSLDPLEWPEWSQLFKTTIQTTN